MWTSITTCVVVDVQGEATWAVQNMGVRNINLICVTTVTVQAKIY